MARLPAAWAGETPERLWPCVIGLWRAFYPGLAPMESNRILRPRAGYAAGFRICPWYSLPQDPIIGEGRSAHEGATSPHAWPGRHFPETAKTVPWPRDLLLVEQTRRAGAFQWLDSTRRDGTSWPDAHQRRGLRVSADVPVFNAAVRQRTWKAFPGLLARANRRCAAKQDRACAASAVQAA